MKNEYTNYLTPFKEENRKNFNRGPEEYIEFEEINSNEKITHAPKKTINQGIRNLPSFYSITPKPKNKCCKNCLITVLILIIIIMVTGFVALFFFGLVVDLFYESLGNYIVISDYREKFLLNTFNYISLDDCYEKCTKNDECALFQANKLAGKCYFFNEYALMFLEQIETSDNSPNSYFFKDDFRYNFTLKTT